MSTTEISELRRTIGQLRDCQVIVLETPSDPALWHGADDKSADDKSADDKSVGGYRRDQR